MKAKIKNGIRKITKTNIITQYNPFIIHNKNI